MMGQLNVNRENSLRLYVSSYTDNPSITDLQNVADVSDAPNLTKGNPDLNPTYSHRVNFHYINSNVEKGRSLHVDVLDAERLRLQCDARGVESPARSRSAACRTQPSYYSTPVNLDGYWSLSPTHLSIPVFRSAS